MRHNIITKKGVVNSSTNSYSFAKKEIVRPSNSAYTHRYSGRISTKVSTPLLPNTGSPDSYSNSKLVLYSPNLESRLLEIGHTLTRAFPYQELNNGGVRR